MNKLMLTPPLIEKLQRLNSPVGDLHFTGVDPGVLLSAPSVAIVGTRKPTPYGIRMTQQITAELSKAGVVIISGLAFGIDTVAHKAALEAKGKTIAVLPSGLGNVYPATHRNVAKQICANGGSLISEYEPTRQPRKAEFLERNRLIAALSDAVIVPEAAKRSGSLNTAGHAKAAGVPVFALPGPIDSQMSAGTNQLIKDGAHIITSALDILKQLDINEEPKQLNLQLEENESRIYTLIKEGVASVDIIQATAGIPTLKVMELLTDLEIEELIAQDSLGKWHTT